MKAVFGAALGIDISCLTSCGVQVTIKTQNWGPLKKIELLSDVNLH